MKKLEGRTTNMEKAAKEIQMENTAQSENPSAAKLCSSTEEQAEKLTMFCFKKRKKPCKKALEMKGVCEEDSVTLKHTSQSISAAPGEGEVSNQSQSSRGTWTTIKRLVTPKRRSKSSRKQTHSDSQVQLEINAEDPGLQSFPKNQVSSGLKIPCIRFSRGKKKPSHSEITEESDCSVKANELMGILNKANSEPENLAITVKSSMDQSFSQASEKSDRNSLNSTGKNALLVESRPDIDQHTQCIVQSEIANSEAVAIMLQEELHQKSLHETPEHTLVANQGVDLNTTLSANVSKDLPDRVAEATEVQEINNIHDTGLECRESGRNINASEDCKSRERIMSFNQSAFKDDAVSVQSCLNEQLKLEENKDASGVSIVITITEADDEPDEEESNQDCKLSSISCEHKQKVNKKISGNLNFSKLSNRKEAVVAGSGPRREAKVGSPAQSPNGLSDQEHGTSEQYELLLIETAASLVKAAIQSSVEQLVNEMALDHSKHNSVL
ncbi:A-kinase anchor protein 5 [Caretta caretta]|uniref:A-kinase anchor protein 5 n=1 Tax=Caretta caretta TaxID=8467 RepID=UPI0020947FA0|nr:A-kinase anchor protein 5 [Caretta caretta]XP_048709576.1 A-kinase anchor protein 5 [Caretta caretta]XP_048709577.1 A-kinase anchor protein 5 [Caretta caretta]